MNAAHGASGAAVLPLPGVELGEVIEGQLWARRLQVARVRLACDWPRVCPSRHLRGAIVARLEESGGASVAWHQHGDDDVAAARSPEVLYRVGLGDGVPEVVCLGPRAAEHAQRLARDVHALWLPAGQVIEVRSVDVLYDAHVVQVRQKAWSRLTLRTPFFPTSTQWGRRPRSPGPERDAWAGQALAASLESFLGACGLAVAGQVHVQVVGLWDARVTWERPGRGDRHEAVGFHADFVANVAIPDGVGIGKHRAEGWGEVRHA